MRLFQLCQLVCRICATRVVAVVSIGRIKCFALSEPTKQHSGYSTRLSYSLAPPLGICRVTNRLSLKNLRFLRVAASIRTTFPRFTLYRSKHVAILVSTNRFRHENNTQSVRLYFYSVKQRQKFVTGLTREHASVFIVMICYLSTQKVPFPFTRVTVVFKC